MNDEIGSDEHWRSRCCERCRTILPKDWDYAWCKECGENGTCHHGNKPEDCNECMIESDLAYDGARESSKVARRNDDPPEAF